MGSNETKKTMRFWIFSGVVAIFASQLPLLLKKKQHDNQAQHQQQKRPWWIKLLIWALIAVTIRIIIWLFNFFT